MEQRAKVAGKAGAAAVYRKFINAMKEKTKLKNEDVAAIRSGVIPNPAQTAMGPRYGPKNVTDRRRKKDKPPVMLKRFRKYIEDHG